MNMVGSSFPGTILLGDLRRFHPAFAAMPRHWLTAPATAPGPGPTTPGHCRHAPAATAGLPHRRRAISANPGLLKNRTYFSLNFAAPLYYTPVSFSSAAFLPL
jgi:hypothetical protein